MCKLNLWISTVIFTGVLWDTTQCAWLRCYKSSLNNYTLTSLYNPTPLLTDSCFDPDLQTMIYTFGYRGKCDGPATTAVLEAYINTKKRNVLLLDWQDEARSNILGIALGYALIAVPNAKKIGHELGDALITLNNKGLNMNEVHLIGHSLGAHVMAYAGRLTRRKGQIISRITGLDPARALFEGTLSIRNGIDRTCAKFVDIIHTNPGNYGTSKATGTVDIWPNYSPSDGMQPGCPTGTFEPFTSEDLCSHDRAWRYLIESVHSPTAFPATAAENFNTWVGMSVPNVTMYVGELTNTRAYGNYFLATQGQSPYSKGPVGMMPDKELRIPSNSSTSPLSAILKFLR